MSLVPTHSPIQFDDHSFDCPLLWMLNDVADAISTEATKTFESLDQLLPSVAEIRIASI